MVIQQTQYLLMGGVFFAIVKGVAAVDIGHLAELLEDGSLDKLNYCFSSGAKARFSVLMPRRSKAIWAAVPLMDLITPKPNTGC